MAECFNEIIGLKKLALYANKDIRYQFPDPSKETEIDLIAHGSGSIVIDENNEQPRWARTLNYSDNYLQNYFDVFSFELHGIHNDVPLILKEIRNNRTGYIVEIITKDNNSYVFPTPVFLDGKIKKNENSNSWTLSLSYRVPTPYDKYKKLNTLLMTRSYIWVGGNRVLGTGNYTPVVSN